MGREILNERQIRFLGVIKSLPDFAKAFYLTGGTALAAFYLNHRESEDLDFFSQKEVEPLAIETFLKKNKKQLAFDIFEFQRSFNRNIFILHSARSFLKVEFTYFPFEILEKGPKEGKLQIDSLYDITVNKIFTISQQTRARDFVDLYFIMNEKKFKLIDLVRDAQLKFETHIDLIQLGSQLLKVKSLKDWPRMRTAFDKKDFNFFFLKEAKKLKKKILD